MEQRNDQWQERNCNGGNFTVFISKKHWCCSESCTSFTLSTDNYPDMTVEGICTISFGTYRAIVLCHSCFREMLMYWYHSGVVLSKMLTASCKQGWILPSSGILYLDFVASSRPSVGEKSLPEPDFTRLWTQLICCDTKISNDRPLTDDWKLSLLSVLCYDYFFSSAQAKRIVDNFFHGLMKIEAAVLVSFF